jgi:hypothetical protein
VPIDINRLELVKKAANGKVTARCPACAQNGSDVNGAHLVIYPDGKFGCAANQGDKKHRQRIFKLAGVMSGEPRKPKPIPIKRKIW